MSKTNDDQPVNSNETFESFWADFTDNRVIPTVDILGVDVPVPHDVSLGLQQRVFAANGEDVEGMQELLEQMFGEEILEALVENGLTGDQMIIVLAWGVMNGSGNKVTFREAAQQFYSNQEGAEHPPAKLPAKKTGGNGRKKSTPSSSTGRTSSRTSGGTGSSGRKTSRT